MKRSCPFCHQEIREEDMIWADVQNRKGEADFILHYTTKRFKDAPCPEDVVLCGRNFNGQVTSDYYTLHEALAIGHWLLRAVLDKQVLNGKKEL